MSEDFCDVSEDFWEVSEDCWVVGADCVVVGVGCVDGVDCVDCGVESEVVPPLVEAGLDSVVGFVGVGVGVVEVDDAGVPVAEGLGVDAGAGVDADVVVGVDAGAGSFFAADDADELGAADDGDAVPAAAAAERDGAGVLFADALFADVLFAGLPSPDRFGVVPGARLGSPDGDRPVTSDTS